MTKGLAPDIFLTKFDEIANVENFNTTDNADKAEMLRKCMVETCDKMLKKVSCMTNKKYSNKKYSIGGMRRSQNCKLRLTKY